MKIIPHNDFLLISPAESETKTTGGICLPDTIDSLDQIRKGKVLAVGGGWYTNTGTLIPLRIKQGQTVLFHKGHGRELEVDGVKMRLLREGEVLAVVE